MNKIFWYILIILINTLSIFARTTTTVQTNQIIFNISNDFIENVCILDKDSSGYYYKFTIAGTKGIVPQINKSIINSLEAIKTESLKQFVFFKSGKEISENNVIMNKVGTQRGIDIYLLKVYPAFFNENKWMIARNQYIEIVFNKPIEISGNDHTDNIYAIDNLVNLTHLPYLEKYYDRLKASEYQVLRKSDKSSDWYNPEFIYYEINTRTDGIGSLAISKLLNLDQTFFGKNPKNLHLLINGLSIPYFVNDSNSGLDDSDTLFFISSRPNGDTTWFSNFSNTATFYLYYDSQAESEQYDYMPTLSPIPDNKVSSVFSKFHLEKDSLYSEGIHLEISPITSGEGWFHKLLNPSADTIISIRHSFFPAPNTNIEISSAFYCHKVFAQKNRINHRILSSINNMNHETKEWYYLENDYAKVYKRIIMSNSFYFGENNIQYKSLGCPENGQVKYSQDELAYNFTEISAHSLPITIDDKSDFYVDTLSVNSTLEIFPFSSPQITAIDTINKYYCNGRVKRGMSLSVNTSNEIQNTIFTINNKIVAKSNKIGFHLLQINPATMESSYFYFSEIEIDKYISKINSISDKSIIAIAVNANNLNSDQLNLLKSIEFETDNYDSKDCITGIQERNKATINFSNSTGISKSISFIENSISEMFSYSIDLSSGRDYHIFTSSNSQIEIAEIKKVYESNLQNTQNQYNFIVITSRDFENSAKQYITYREQTHKDLKFTIAFVEDIYKEFNFGRKEPNAIKNYLKFAYNNWSKPKLETVLLLGDACFDSRKILDITSKDDFVPSYGNPLSDNWYSWLDEDDDLLNDILISRIPIKNSVDMNNYLEKLKSYDNSPNAPWKNSLLFLSGGNDFTEINNFRLMYANPNMEIFDQSNLCHSSEIISKSTEGSTNFTDGIRVINSLNSGKIFTIFVGHGSPVVFDLDGWMPDNLSNTGKYGIFYTISCNTAAFGLPDANTRFEEYLFSKEKGFIFCIGSSFTENPYIGNIVLQNSSRNICNNNYRNPLLSFTDSKTNSYLNFINRSEGVHLKNYLYHGNTLGDPLLTLPMDTLPELYLLPEEFKITNSSGIETITDNEDYANTEFTVRNLGVSNFDSIQVMIIDSYNSNSDTLFTSIANVCPRLNISIPLLIKDKIGLHSLTIVIDPDSLINEHRKDNNKLVKQFEVLQKSLLPVEPMPYQNVCATNPIFRFINPLSQSQNKTLYKFEIWKYTDKNDPIMRSKSENITIDNSIIDWSPNISLTPDNNYYLIAYYINEENGNISNYTNIPFHSVADPLSQTVNNKISKEQLEIINSTNLTYHPSTSMVEYKSDSTSFSLLGINGFSDDERTIHRGVYLTINGEYILSIPKDLIGFHIAHCNRDFSNFRFRHFNTWGVESDENAYIDSASINMIKYLRDSINIDDNLFIATMGQSFRLFSLHQKWHTTGSWDTLKSVLDKFGSKLTNQIDTMYKKDNAWGISYAFAGNIHKSHSKIFESLNLAGDSARVSGKLVNNPLFANLSYTIDNVDKMHSISILPLNTLNQNIVNTRVYAWNVGEQIKTLIIDTNNVSTIDFINKQSDYQNYQVNYNFIKNSNEPVDLSFSELNAIYTPSAELTIIKSSEELRNDLLNGDDDFVNFRVKNISFRRTVDSALITVSANNLTTDIDKYYRVIKNLTPNLEVDYIENIITDNYPHSFYLRANIENLKKYDIYHFNNTLHYYQDFLIDNEKPQIFLELDGHIVNDGEYIPIRPKFRAFIKDNSPRTITGESNLRVRLNTQYATSTNTDEYQFISHPRQSEIKAELLFLPDSLDFDDNIIRIYAEDANQNRDTAYYKLIVNRKGSIISLSIYPNPLQVNSTIEFDYAAPAIGGYSLIEIFNYSGQIINSYKMPLNIGKNQIPIFISDRNNAPLPQGMYFYRISISGSEVFVEPMMDKFIIVR